MRQMLILVEKPGNGGVTTQEILPVRFSQLESAEAALQNLTRAASIISGGRNWWLDLISFCQQP
jgi:hypothetical protein